MTDLDRPARDRLCEMAAKATPGPWIVDVHRPGPGGAVVHRDCVLTEAWPHREVAAIPFSNPEPKMAVRVANMDYITAACNAAPALVEQVNRLEDQLDAYRKAKAENDERFMLERDAALRERDEARQQVERLRAAAEKARPHVVRQLHTLTCITAAQRRADDQEFVCICGLDAALAALDAALKP